MTAPRWDDVVAFRAVAQESSFTRAATRLFVTQPSVSSRVRRLESRLGVRLLERTTRSVRPTERGRILLDWAERVERSWTRTEELLVVPPQPDEPAAPEIRLGLVPDERCRTVGHLGAFLPGTTLDTTVDPDARPLLDLLSAARLDAVLAATSNGIPDDGAPGVHVVTVVHEPRWVLLGDRHPLAREATLTLADLRDDTWFTGPPSNPSTAWERSVLHRHGVTRVRSSSATAERLAVVDRGGAVHFASPLHRPDGRRRVVPLVDPAVAQHLYLAWHPSRVDQDAAARLLRGARSAYRAAVADVPRYRVWIDEHPEQFPGVAAGLED